MSSPLKEQQNAKTKEFLKAIFGDTEANAILNARNTAKIKKQDKANTKYQIKDKTAKNSNFSIENYTKQKRIPTEAEEARKLTQYLKLNRFCFLHIPNERKATARQIAELKRQGLQKGAPDYLIFTQKGLIAIELKRAMKSKSKVSNEQKEFIANLNEFKYCKAFLAYGANEAIEILKDEK